MRFTASRSVGGVYARWGSTSTRFTGEKHESLLPEIAPEEKVGEEEKALTLRLSEAEYARLMAGKRAAPSRATPPAPTPRRWEEEFAAQLDARGITYVREYRFMADRKFRFDIAIVIFKIAVEVDGQVHRIRERFASDREKMNLALLQGWRVLHVGSEEVQSGQALDMLLRLCVM